MALSRGLIALLIALVVGCFGPVTIEIAHKPEPNIVPLPGAASSRVFVIGEDQRANKTRVGQWPAGYEEQVFVSKDDISDVFRNAIEEELRARGFDIGAGPTSSEVRIQVLKFRSYFTPALFNPTATAELIMHVQVERPGKVITYSQNFETTDTASHAGFSDALGGALDKGIESLLGDPAFSAALIARPSHASIDQRVLFPKSQVGSQPNPLANFVRLSRRPSSMIGSAIGRSRSTCHGQELGSGGPGCGVARPVRPPPT
jgi:uncharacterized lipoprotein YajG